VASVFWIAAIPALLCMIVLILFVREPAGIGKAGRSDVRLPMRSD